MISCPRFSFRPYLFAYLCVWYSYTILFFVWFFCSCSSVRSLVYHIRNKNQMIACEMKTDKIGDISTKVDHIKWLIPIFMYFFGKWNKYLSMINYWFIRNSTYIQIEEKKIPAPSLFCVLNLCHCDAIAIIIAFH